MFVRKQEKHLFLIQKVVFFVNVNKLQNSVTNFHDDHLNYKTLTKRFEGKLPIILLYNTYQIKFVFTPNQEKERSRGVEVVSLKGALTIVFRP